MDSKPSTSFEQASAQQPGGGILREFWEFLKDNKKWWLIPLLLILLVQAILLFLSGSAAAPFIYPLF
jgi:hypothetical protein